MTVSRIYPTYVAEERSMLEAWLDFHRATLELKCEGLSAEQLRQRAVPPSTLSLLGLVRHMAEVERSWFRRTLMDEDVGPLYYSDVNPDGDFDDVDAADPTEAFAAWHAECDRARSLAAGIPSLEAVGARHRDPAPENQGNSVSLRWIFVHMIEEYARHNGHADLLRQRIDGSVGE